MASTVHYFISERWTGVSNRRYHTWAQQDVGTTRSEVVRQIIADELSPFQILEVIPDEQVINDVTADIAQDVRDVVSARNEPCPDHLVNFIESNTVGFVRAASAMEAA